VGIFDGRDLANLVAATGTELAACGQFFMAANKRSEPRRSSTWSLIQLWSASACAFFSSIVLSLL
jgi:hypothetical protein